MNSKKRTTKSSKLQKRVVNKYIIGAFGLIFSFFVFMIVAGQQQDIRERAQTISSVTPTFSTIGDCQINHTCPTTNAAVSTTAEPTMHAIAETVITGAPTVDPCTSTNSINEEGP